jgi:DNA-binding LytR/AlgR family response regulator
LAREAIRGYIKKMPELEVAGECKNALQAMSVLRKKTTDLIFLDIEMPEISGISFLQNMKNTPAVIFTTAYRDYAVDAFALDVIDYLVKPISFDRFVSAMEKFYARTQKPAGSPHESANESGPTLKVRADRKTYILDISRIRYIESLKDYVKIVCTDESVVTHDTLANLEAFLKNHGLIRVHRSFLVALDKISSFDAESVFVGQKEIPLSRTYKKAVLAILENN